MIIHFPQYPLSLSIYNILYSLFLTNSMNSYDIIPLTKIYFSYNISLLLGELLLRFTEICRMSRFRINPHNLTRLMPA